MPGYGPVKIKTKIKVKFPNDQIRLGVHFVSYKLKQDLVGLVGRLLLTGSAA